MARSSHKRIEAGNVHELRLKATKELVTDEHVNHSRWSAKLFGGWDSSEFGAMCVAPRHTHIE
jgi:hypothetical protein